MSNKDGQAQVGLIEGIEEAASESDIVGEGMVGGTSVGGRD